MQFEWDEQKNAINKAKHHISFELATRVFADSERLEQYDVLHSDMEDRWITIGMVHPAIIVVIFTERMQGNVVRLISARRANEQERRAYYEI